jgi:hypothetical protein
MKRTLITLFISTLLCAATFALAQSPPSANAPTSKSVVTFAASPKPMSLKLLLATPDNVKKANNYIDAVEMRDGTNFSAAVEASLSFGEISSLFLLSDGEPYGGIIDPSRLLAFIREKNKQHVPIMTLALGLGESSPGFDLLKSIAKDNSGKYDYINLAREKTERSTGERKP